MPHDTLISTMAIGLVLALLLGVIAARFALPPIVGYLVGGIIIGLVTPGAVTEGGTASQASELGVVLLMFGVGLHFSLRDLMAVRATVLPGALLQLAVTGTLGTVLG